MRFPGGGYIYMRLSKYVAFREARQKNIQGSGYVSSTLWQAGCEVECSRGHSGLYRGGERGGCYHLGVSLRFQHTRLECVGRIHY